MKISFKTQCLSLFLLCLCLFAALSACSPNSIFPTHQTSLTTVTTPNLKPASLTHLRAIQTDTQEVLKKVSPAVVNIKVNRASGTGVIVSNDGIILTAGHVSGSPNQRAHVTLNNGFVVIAKTLGNTDDSIDCGMLKILDGQLVKYNKANNTKLKHWPTAKMGNSDALKIGQWVVALGHPGGYNQNRGLVLRIGRVRENYASDIITDCTIVGGDSGGPLFDLQGNIIGIHKSIGSSLAHNLHVPISKFDQYWDPLVSSKEIISNDRNRRRSSRDPRFSRRLGVRPALGAQVITNTAANGAKIKFVFPESPADDAGLKTNDLIIKLDKHKIKTAAQLYLQIGKIKNQKSMMIKVLRDKKQIDIELKIIQSVVPRPNTTPFLGVDIQSHEGADYQGVFIKNVVPDTAAKLAKLQSGDVILQCDDKQLYTRFDLLDLLEDHKPGDIIKLKIYRDDKPKTIKVTLGYRPIAL